MVTGRAGLALLLRVLALMAAHLWLAQALATELIIRPNVPDAGAPFEITLAGTWPDSCTPVTKSVVVDGNNLVLSATTTMGPCAQVMTPFEVGFSVDVSTHTLPSNGVFYAQFMVNVEGDPLARLIAFDLVSVADTTVAVITPEDGWWWAEAGGEFETSGPGTGYFFERQGETLAIGSAVYDEDGGPLWLLSAGERRHNVFTNRALAFAGGQSLFGEYLAPDIVAEIATMHIEFIERGRALIWFSAPAADSTFGEVTIWAVSVVRHNFGFPTAASSMLGRWLAVLPAELVPGDRVREFSLGEYSDQGEGRFIYDDESGAGRMACRFSAARPDSPPISCTLYESTVADGIEFERVGLHAMESDSTARLFRLD